MNADEPQLENRVAPSTPADGTISPELEPESESALTEDLALAELRNRDLAPETVERIGRNAGLMKSRKVRMALAAHPRTPRRMALRIIRESFTFEMMQFALTPSAAADLKRIAEELLVSRLASVTLGEKITLARRASPLVAGSLLLDKDKQVWQPALENPRVTEVAIVKALQKTGASAAFVEAVSHHAKWSVRNEVRIALLRNAHTPVAKAIEFARPIPAPQLRDILHASRLPENVKKLLRKDREKDDQ